MLFSSPLFLFAFLPALFAFYFLAPRTWRNGVLLFASLLFFAWGEPVYLLLMTTSIVVNWWFGARIDRVLDDERAKRRLVIGAVVFNLALLGFFKYADWLLAEVGRWLVAVGVADEHWPTFATLLGDRPFARDWLLSDTGHLRLPIGISFFTFQALSYVLDVARRDASVQRNIRDFALYKSLFPQLIAGPIVRYKDVAAEIVTRTVTREGFAWGVRRFVLGLAKKVLIANVVAKPVDAIFALPSADLSCELAWLAVVGYTLQIYFDFSGYSDMAIGLGRMFGFRFLENFEHPYVSRSITEFWRRWHISLSSWFRDYLYIPLGGNRRGRARTYFNLVVVFALCGLWHGASWTFLFWGLYHGAFLVLERAGLGAGLERTPRPLRHVYVLLVVMVGWVFFRADRLERANEILAAMFGAAPFASAVEPLALHLDRMVACALVAGVIGSMPWLDAVRRAYELRVERGASPVFSVLLEVGAFATLIGLFWLSAMQLASSAYNPFIYFRF